MLGGLVLPNLLPLAAALWIGLPPRSAAIAAYATVALLARRVPTWAVVVLFLACCALDFTILVQMMFFMDFAMLCATLPSVSALSLHAAPYYLGFAVAVAISTAVGIAYLVQNRAAMSRGSAPALFTAVLSALAADVALNGNVRFEAGPAAAIGQPFHSAAGASGFEAAITAKPPSRHVLFVMVESLGQLRDVRADAVLFSPFDNPELRAHYAVTRGTTAFFGSTAYGEMRELCGTRRSYHALLGQQTPDCFPQRLSRAGYRTLSVHGFSSHFYDRQTWYPRAGFDESLFLDTHEGHASVGGHGVPRCGGAFAGLCDVALGASIDARLSQATEPYFVYWLTLNTHVPVVPGHAVSDLGCRVEPFGGPFGDHEVCAMAELWHDLFKKIGELALRHRGTEILLVGDHAPPLWRRRARQLFQPNVVPWLRIAPLEDAIRPAEVAFLRR